MLMGSNAPFALTVMRTAGPPVMSGPMTLSGAAAKDDPRVLPGWRAELSRRLIEERGFTWIGVEGDWPDCWRINRWVRGQDHQALDVNGLLAGFERWPTWMWANSDVVDFLD